MKQDQMNKTKAPLKGVLLAGILILVALAGGSTSATALSPSPSLSGSTLTVEVNDDIWPDMPVKVCLRQKGPDAGTVPCDYEETACNVVAGILTDGYEALSVTVGMDVADPGLSCNSVPGTHGRVMVTTNIETKTCLYTVAANRMVAYTGIEECKWNLVPAGGSGAIVDGGATVGAALACSGTLSMVAGTMEAQGNMPGGSRTTTDAVEAGQGVITKVVKFAITALVNAPTAGGWDLSRPSDDLKATVTCHADGASIWGYGEGGEVPREVSVEIPQHASDEEQWETERCQYVPGTLNPLDRCRVETTHPGPLSVTETSVHQWAVCDGGTGDCVLRYHWLEAKTCLADGWMIWNEPLVDSNLLNDVGMNVADCNDPKPIGWNVGHFYCTDALADGKVEAHECEARTGTWP